MIDLSITFSANKPTDLYGRREVDESDPNTFVSEFSVYTNITGTLRHDFDFSFFNANATLNSSGSSSSASNGPTGQFGSEGQYGLVKIVAKLFLDITTCIIVFITEQRALSIPKRIYICFRNIFIKSLHCNKFYNTLPLKINIPIFYGVLRYTYVFIKFNTRLFYLHSFFSCVYTNHSISLSKQFFCNEVRYI